MIRVCSIFSQWLQVFPRTEFAQAVKPHKAARHARGFDGWTQLMARWCCQLGRAQSLRELCGGLAATEGKRKHLGVARALRFAPGTIRVFYRGYQDYRWFERLTQEGAFFVLRLRGHAHIEVLEDHPVRPGGTILRDQTVRLGTQRYQMKIDLRRIEPQDPDTGQTILLITNRATAKPRLSWTALRPA